MSTHSLARLINIALRGMTLGSNFVLIFVLAKLLEPAEVGLYGLMTVNVGYMLMALGFGFYTYATRELINTDRCRWSVMLKDKSAFV